MVATVVFKSHMAGACIFDNVVEEFSHWEKYSPIFFLVIDESSEVSLHCTFLPLDLAINLRVEGSKEPLFDFPEVT